MRRIMRWLRPGLNLKRWLLLFTVGAFLMGLGISFTFRGDLIARIENYALKQFNQKLSRVSTPVAGALLFVVGGGLAGLGMRQTVKSVLNTVAPGAGGQMAEVFYQRRNLVRGPRIVAIGGGTGIPVLLRGLKKYTSNITAIVTVADDGGSSGRLRGEFGILPPGDIRNCLVALADTEPLMEALFQYRFTQGSGLAGHNFGNLFILAMSEIAGDFEEAIRQSSSVLAVRGRVLPSTLDQVILKAELQDGSEVVGESRVSGSHSSIRRVYLEPATSRPLPEAISGILDADVIILGPGSLYTSVIPNLLVPGITEAIRRSRALKVYICNVMTEPGETEGYTAADHVRAITDHVGYGLLDYCLVNSQSVPEDVLAKYREQGAQPVIANFPGFARLGVAPVESHMAEGADLVRHDPDRLAAAIAQLIVDKRSTLETRPWDILFLRDWLRQAAHLTRPGAKTRGRKTRR